MKKTKEKKLEPSLTVDDDLKKIVVVLIITNKGFRETLAKKLIREAKVKYLTVFDARDLDYLPNAIFEKQMYDSRQEVYLVVCQNVRVNQIMEIVQQQCELLVEPKARVLSVPLSSLINYNLFQLLGSK